MSGTVLARDYRFLRSILKEQIGYNLDDGKEYLIESRLAPVAAHFDIADVHDLVETLRSSERPEIIDAVCEAMTTNETSFFRDHAPFKELAEFAIPELIRARKPTRSLRIWSAACSTGQEPYSIAMTLLDHFPGLDSWDVEILASDVSARALKVARSGHYTRFDVQRGVPVRTLVKRFERDGNGWRVRPEVREQVNFMRFNLLGDYALLGGTFDIVLLRNVLIYFDGPTKRQIYAKMSGAIRPDGFLFLGGSETVLGLTNLFRKPDPASVAYRPAPFFADRDAS